MDAPVVIGSLGVGFLLLAFFLNLFDLLPQHAKTYAVLNILGAGLAGYASALIGFVPFAILESVWTLVAVIGLIRARKTP